MTMITDAEGYWVNESGERILLMGKPIKFTSREPTIQAQEITLMDFRHYLVGKYFITSEGKSGKYIICPLCHDLGAQVGNARYCGRCERMYGE